MPNRPQLAQVIDQNSYGYDANGNQTSRSGPAVSSGTQTVTYNAFDMPRTITAGTGDNTVSVGFEYGAGEERVVKRVNNPVAVPDVTTYFSGGLYQRRVQDPAGSASTEHRYRVFAGGQEIAQLVRAPGSSTLSRFYLHADALGSAQTVTDSGTTVLHQSFEPFGSASPGVPSGTTGVLSGFTGHQHDTELGLIDMGGRAMTRRSGGS